MSNHPRLEGLGVLYPYSARAALSPVFSVLGNSSVSVVRGLTGLSAPLPEPRVPLLQRIESQSPLCRRMFCSPSRHYQRGNKHVELLLYIQIEWQNQAGRGKHMAGPSLWSRGDGWGAEEGVFWNCAQTVKFDLCRGEIVDGFSIFCGVRVVG